MEPAARYLDLLKLCLTRLVFFDEEVRDFTRLCELPWDSDQSALFATALAERGLRLVEGGGDRSARVLARSGRCLAIPTPWWVSSAWTTSRHA